MERFTFGDSVTGLKHAFMTTRTLRKAGFKTKLTTGTLYGFTVHTLHAAPPARPTRKERGCYVHSEAIRAVAAR